MRTTRGRSTGVISCRYRVRCSIWSIWVCDCSDRCKVGFLLCVFAHMQPLLLHPFLRIAGPFPLSMTRSMAPCHPIITFVSRAGRDYLRHLHHAAPLIALAGTATHTRGLYFQRTPAQVANPAAPSDDGDWIVVVDRLTSDRPRSLQMTWHAHPNSTGISFNASSGVSVIGGVDGATGLPTTAQVSQRTLVLV